MTERGRGHRATLQPGYWFAQARYGRGIVPATWQGWCATIGVLGSIGAIVAVFGIGPRTGMAGLALTFGYIWLLVTRTEGDVRWRWGNDE